MLKLSSATCNQPVLSLRTSGPVGLALEPIINPNNLKIIGFYCQDSRRSKHPLILLSQDIREWIPQGFAINDYDALTEPEDLVRLKKVLDLQFELLGKPVYTDGKRRLGKVNDYAVDVQSFDIQKIYVSQNLLKNFAGTALTVDRSQIVEITNKRVVIRDPLQGVPHSAVSPVSA